MHQTIKYPAQESKSTLKQALDVLSILVNLTIIAVSLLILQELRKKHQDWGRLCTVLPSRKTGTKRNAWCPFFTRR